MSTAILILPGGGYNHIGRDCRGEEIPDWFRRRGIFPETFAYPVNVPYPEARNEVEKELKSMRKVYSRVGILGFSAGGHLAGGFLADPQVSFLVLAYPVVTLVGPFAHRRSAECLVTRSDPYDTQQERQHLSLQNLKVGHPIPPTFLFHMTRDQKVPVENSIMLFQSLRRQEADVELHLFDGEGHGAEVSMWDDWLNVLEGWLLRKQFLSKTV